MPALPRESRRLRGTPGQGAPARPRSAACRPAALRTLRTRGGLPRCAGPGPRLRAQGERGSPGASPRAPRRRGPRRPRPGDARRRGRAPRRGPRPAAHCPRPGGSRGPALLPGRARGLLLRAFGREPRNCDPAPPSAPRHSDPPRPGASQRFQPVHLCRRLTGERASEAAEMRLLSPEEVSPEECCMRTR